MGRHPKPKSEKIAAGTYRPDRDKSQALTIDNNTPEPPDDLGPSGMAFWGLAYDQPWVTPGDKTIVRLIAEKLDERELVSEQFHLDPANFRHPRTLKEIDRDILHGLDQLLLTPNARKRAGLELAKEPETYPTREQLVLARGRGEISHEDYERLMEPHRQASEQELRQQARTDLLEDMQDASLRVSHALLDPDGAARRQQGYK
jgi:hypothetical protein